MFLWHKSHCVVVKFPVLFFSAFVFSLISALHDRSSRIHRSAKHVSSSPFCSCFLTQLWPGSEGHPSDQEIEANVGWKVVRLTIWEWFYFLNSAENKNKTYTILKSLNGWRGCNKTLAAVMLFMPLFLCNYHLLIQSYRIIYTKTNLSFFCLVWIGLALTSAHQAQSVTSLQTCFMWRCSWTPLAS